MRNSLLTIMLGCILLFVACGCGSTANATRATASATPAAHTLPSPTSLQVTRITPPATSSLPGVDKTITDANKVQELYRMALASTVVPQGAVLHCPVALAQYQYRLLFFHDKLTVSQMTLNDEGCIFLNINSDPRVHEASNDFINLLLKEMGRSSLQS